MLKEFVQWFSYHFLNVPFRELVVPAILLWLVFALIMFFGSYLFIQERKHIKKLCVFSVLISPYLIFVFFWEVCFADKTVLERSLCIYPALVLFLVELIIVMKHKKSLRNKEREECHG